jgi:hypothetical protein
LLGGVVRHDPSEDEVGVGHIARSGTTTFRGSRVPDAASGSIGVKSMKFSGLTMVAPRRLSLRAT